MTRSDAERATLLCIGDVHLGRTPRVPDDLEGLDAESLGPRAALEATVREALARRVRAVVFLGDVVDDDDAFVESWSLLYDEVRRLTEEGIEVFAVVGNHDHKVLPRLADQVPGFRLIGRGGVWEEVALEANGAPWLRLCGWSFPGPRVSVSPLADFTLEGARDVPRVGLLHADLGAAGGDYAPVRQRELEEAPVDAWLLGHVHKPSREELAAERPQGYLGSLTGLDPTETGPHGPWLAHVDGALCLEPLPLAPLVWERIDLDVGELADADELEPALVGALHEHAGRIRERLGGARAVGCRVHLVGEHTDHAGLARRVAALELERIRPNPDERPWFVDRVIDESTPALDLQAIARGSDPPGLLARRLLALRAADPATEELVRVARGELQRLADAHPWSALDRLDVDDAAARVRLERAGLAVLEALVADVETPA